MLKTYCKIAFGGWLLCILSTANAQQTIGLNSTCTEYYEEVQRLLELGARPEVDTSTFRDLDHVNPARDFLDPLLQSLDQDARERIVGPLTRRVWYNCKDLEKRGLSSGSKVNEALDRAIEYFGLDMMQPRWGLIDLPRIDFDKMRPGELDEVLSEVPIDALQNPVNDIFSVAFGRYALRFDLSSHEAEDKIQKLAAGLSFLDGLEDAERTICELLDEQAIELGLEFRPIKN